MAQYTANYQLHQWVPEDNFLRTDFNQDFQKIDTALAGLKTLADGKAGTAALDAERALAEGRTRAILGGYVGDGNSPREINVGAVPEGVLGCSIWDPLYRVHAGMGTGIFRSPSGALKIHGDPP